MLEVRPFSQRDRRFQELARRRALSDPDLERQAAEIILRVGKLGDAGLVDAGSAGPLVPETELMAAREVVSEQFLTALSLARVNLRKFHECQRRTGYLHDDGDGVRLSRLARPLSRIGICCGHSFAALLQHAVPAQMAGVGRIAVAAAPGPGGAVDPHVLAAARILGLDEVYRMTGAAAVAAFAQGTESVAPVDKIVGPGGALATAAKRLVRDRVGVDPERGAGEFLVVADAGANAKFIAADFLAQAEHDDGCGLLVLLATDRFLAEAVRIEMDRLVELAPDPKRLRKRFAACGALFLCRDLDTALEAANALAPARLALMTRDNEACLSEIENAGAVLMGPWSMEAAAEYFAGANPFLPLAGSARYASGLGLEDFVRDMTVVEYSPERLLKTGRHLSVLAEADASPAHAAAVRERLELLRLTVD